MQPLAVEPCDAVLDAAVKKHPGKIAFYENGTPCTTYSELQNFANRCFEAFRALNPFFCLRLGRGAEEASVLISCLRAGTPGFSAEKKTPPLYVQGLLKQFAPTHLLIRESDWRREQAILCPMGREVFRYRWGGATEDTLIIETGNRKSLPEDIAWVLLTSGSTGRRKAVGFSGPALRTRAGAEVCDFQLRNSDTLMNLLSFAHDLGLNQLLTTIALGASLDIFSNILPSDILSILRRGGHDGITGTPMVWRNLLDVVAARDCRIEGFRYLTVSGGSLSPAQLTALAAIFPSTKIICTYGQTETFRTFFSVFPDDGSFDGLFHRLVSGVSAALVTGELIHSGPSSASVIADHAVWQLCPNPVPTGDLFEREPSGAFRFVGRRDQMVKRSDYRLYLSEIESELATCALIAQAAVFAADRDKLVAFIEPSRLGRTMDEMTLKLEIGRRLPYYMVPDRIHIRETLPRTGAAKVNRELLREELNEALA